MKIAIVQPTVPVYREEFFRELHKYVDLSIFVLKDSGLCHKEQTLVSDLQVQKLKNRMIKGLVFYDYRPLFHNRYDVIVLMQTKVQITTWLLLLTKWLHRKKIVLWGQGVTIRNYDQEQETPNFLRKIQMKMSDGLWLYMEKEYNIWHKWLPNKPMVSLNNTVSYAEQMVSVDVYTNKKKLKVRYGILQEKVIIFCARFETSPRRTDLLVETIKRLDPSEFAFIIIGDGRDKPDFSPYKNVYEFGSLYDMSKKSELFIIADIYFQPGWVGLSIVEAMAYAKPICTFVRSKETLQCVEYSYIQQEYNGLIFMDMEDCINKFRTTSIADFRRMGDNARLLVKTKLTPENMAGNAWGVIRQLA